jgi:hypothetical protein
MGIDMSPMTTLLLGLQLFLPHKDILTELLSSYVGIQGIEYGRCFSCYLTRAHVTSFWVRFIKIRVHPFSAPCRSV